MKYTSFSSFDEKFFNLKEGLIFKPAIFCVKNYNTKCKEFYIELASKKTGYYTCPYGFGVCKKNYSGSYIIYTSLNIEKHSDRKLMRKRISKSEFLPKISIEDFERITKGYQILWSSYIYNKNENREHRELSKAAKESKSLIDNTVHELRKLNNQIKMQSETLVSLLDEISCFANNCDLPELKNRVFNIFSTSQLISTRLDAYDFSVNPDITSHSKKVRYNVYKKFEKASHCIDLTASKKNLRIDFIGNNSSIFRISRIFELIPFMLFENAVKYSPEDTVIKCVFEADEERLVKIIVSNLGPRPIKEEVSKIKQKNFRSESVGEFSGQGLGLYICDVICEYHNITLTPTLSDDMKMIQGKEYTTFNVELDFSKLSPVF